MSILIKGGRVVTAADDYVADVFIEGEKVHTIGRDLSVRADEVIDATGKLVIPGGIDPHTHLDMPFGGTNSADDFESGTIAAGDPFELLARNDDPVTLRLLWQVTRSHRPSAEALSRLTGTSGLSESWAEKLRGRLEWLRRKG